MQVHADVGPSPVASLAGLHGRISTPTSLCTTSANVAVADYHSVLSAEEQLSEPLGGGHIVESAIGVLRQDVATLSHCARQVRPPWQCRSYQQSRPSRSVRGPAESTREFHTNGNPVSRAKPLRLPFDGTEPVLHPQETRGDLCLPASRGPRGERLVVKTIGVEWLR